MVVGDRLWLFSQTPAGPAPLQSIMLNGGASGNVGPPSSISPLAANQLRAYPASNLMPTVPSPSVIESARNAILARGQPLNYALAPYLAQRSATSASSLSPTSRYVDYAAVTSNLYQNSPASNDAYLQMKYNVLNNLQEPETETTPGSNGLAELERVFGDTNANFLEHKSGGGVTERNGKSSDFGYNGLALTQRTVKSATGNDSDSECSEIDCEQIDDE